MYKLTIMRRKAREFALQAIYSWKLSQNKISVIEKQFFLKKNFKNIDTCYFYDLIRGVIKKIDYLDNLIKPYLLLHIKRLGEVEKIILKISLFELIEKPDVPYKVVINEGIELVKSFGNYKSYKFINGVLDQIGFHIRPDKK